MINFLGKKLSPPKKPKKPIRKLGRLGKLRAKGKRDAKLHYWGKYGQQYGMLKTAHCQSCGDSKELSDLDSHHAKKASAGGTEDFANMVCLCRRCHSFCHQPGFTERLDHVAQDGANVENGRIINWQHHTNALTKWRLNWI